MLEFLIWKRRGSLFLLGFNSFFNYFKGIIIFELDIYVDFSRSYFNIDLKVIGYI